MSTQPTSTTSSEYSIAARLLRIEIDHFNAAFGKLWWVFRIPMAPLMWFTRYQLVLVAEFWESMAGEAPSDDQEAQP